MSIWMTTRMLAFTGILAALTVGAGSSMAAEQNPMPVVAIKNGINRFVLDGKEFMAVRALRENFNAHDFDVVTLYVHDADTWKLVPLFGDYADNKGAEHDLLTVSGGSDCVLHDFRLLPGSATHSPEIVVADRELGRSFADSNPVHFTYFELTKNEDGVPGWPALYFKMQKSSVAKSTYCDVNEALDNELHRGSEGHVGG